MTASQLTSKAVQTFKAADMPSALVEIKRALGPEALIVSVRQVPGGEPWQVWKKPGVEVVAMSAKPAALPTAPKAATPKAAANTAPDKTAEMRAAILALAAGRAAAPEAATRPAPVPEPPAQRSAVAAHPEPAAVTAATLPAPAPAGPSVLEQARAHLTAQGLLPALVTKVTNATARNLSATALADTTRVTWHMQQQLEAVLLTETEASFNKRKVVCLIGATGAGKTTMAARLAARATQLRGRSVAWACADTLRAGAIAQARVYAETLKLPLRVVYTPGELAQAVEAESQADLILVDLPGCNPRRENAVVELGAFLAALPERATYWVAPATAKDADLADALAAFHPFRLTGLIITKLDETATYGSVYNVAWQSRLPLAYFTTGPRVLDELLPAAPEKLAAAIIEGNFRA